MAADVPHVSFLGFEALLPRLDRDALSMSPTGRARWVTVGRQGRGHGHWRIEVERGEKSHTITVEDRQDARGGDHLLVTATATVSAEAPFALATWSIVSEVRSPHGQPIPRTRRLHEGRIKGSKLRLAGAVRPEPALSDRPLCLPWLLPSLVEHDAALDQAPLRTLDLYEGGFSVARKVRLQAVGKAMLGDVPLRGWRVMGAASGPLHVWTGPGGAALLELGTHHARVRARLLGDRE